jgi:hypothetical protein
VDPSDTSETANDIVIVLNAKETGNYEITPYVGDAYNGAAIKGTTIQVEVIDNPEVGSIEVIGLKENELKANSQEALDKEIVFKNKYGVIIPVEAGRIKVEAPSGVIVILLNAEGTAITPENTPSQEIKEIRLATIIEEKTTKTITFTIDGKDFTQDISIGEIEKITGIEVADTVTLYAAKPEDDNTGLIIEDDEYGDIYTLLEISLTSNYGQIPLKANQIQVLNEVEGILSYTDSASAEAGYPVTTIYGYKKEGENIVQAAGEDEIQYIGISAYPLDNLAGETITLTYTSNGTIITKTINIKIGLKPLETLVVTEETGTRYVNEDVVLGKIKEGANEKPVAKEEIKYHVTLGRNRKD